MVAAPAVFESLVSVEDPATTALVVAVASVEATVDATTTVVVAAVEAHMTSAVVVELAVDDSPKRTPLVCVEWAPVVAVVVQ